MELNYLTEFGEIISSIEKLNSILPGRGQDMFCGVMAKYQRHMIPGNKTTRPFYY